MRALDRPRVTGSGRHSAAWSELRHPVSPPAGRRPQTRPGFSAVILLLALLVVPRPASAQSSGCAVRGEATMGPSTKIYSSASGGAPVARFTGGRVELTASDFPAGPSGRARVTTGGGFELKGYVSASDVPVYTSRDVVVHAGHVWIGTQRQVTVVGTAPGKLEVERKVTHTIDQTFRGWAS